MPAAYSLVRTPAQAGFALRLPVLVAGVLLHRSSPSARLHLSVARSAPLARASDAVQSSSTRRLTLLLVQPFTPCRRLLWLLLTSRSALPRRPFRHEARSPRVRNTLLRRTTAGFTPLRLGHKSFAAFGPLALLGSASYPILVHRLTVYAPRFLSTVARPSAVALHFVRCGQLTGGLAPPGVRPCRAHKKRGRVFCRRLWLTIKRHTGLFREVRRRHCYSRLRRPCNLYQDWPTVR